MALHQAPAAITAPQADIEDIVKHDPQFAKALQEQRRQQLGFGASYVQQFLAKTSLMSLGSYCGVAQTFEALGLREAAGPFDWMRTDCQGVTRLIQNGFQGFLDWEGTTHKVGAYDVFPMKWGGSFWHHNIRDAKVQETFERRKDRFLSLNKEKLLFIRAVNGTEELNFIGNLHRALKQRFPKSQVLLLVFIDLQNCPREVIVQDLGPEVIFSSVHHSSWGSLTATTPDGQARERLGKCTELYSAGLIRAIAIWCHCGRVALWPSLKSFYGHLLPWLGPDPKREAFQPFRLPFPLAAATASAAFTLRAITPQAAAVHQLHQFRPSWPCTVRAL